MLAPQAVVSDNDRERATRALMIDAAFATAIGALNSGVVLLALALHIGASTFEVGLLAAVPLLTQVLQAPAVAFVERWRRRKLISVGSVFLARLALPIYAAVPFINSPRIAAATLIAAALLHYGMNAVGACSWNSWIRDLVPEQRLGRFFARRGVYGTLVSAGATLVAAGALVVAARSRSTGDLIFSGLYIVGFICGLFSTGALATVPEPQMPPASRGSLTRLLTEPLRDPRFRGVLRFLVSWQFAVNLAVPFFTVYFVRGLGFSMSFVLILSLVSQLASVAVVRGWGSLSDRLSNKSVLEASTPVYLLCVVGMAFAHEVPGMAGQGAYLLLAHVVMGAAGAGVALASGNIVMKTSPQGSGTSYMATGALFGAIAAGVAPIIGGAMADFVARRRLELRLLWSSPHGTERLFGLTFSYWEFFFLLSALLGSYALFRLSKVQDPGSVERRETVDEIWSGTVRTLRNASSVAGPRLATVFPAAQIIRAREGTRFLLERFFTERLARSVESETEKVGELLAASYYAEPASDASMDDLMRQLNDIK
jgi:MFS family permease